MATDSRAASSMRHRITRSTSAISACLAAGSCAVQCDIPLDAGEVLEALADLQASGAGFAIDEDLCHGRIGAGNEVERRTLKARTGCASQHDTVRGGPVQPWRYLEQRPQPSRLQERLHEDSRVPRQGNLAQLWRTGAAWHSRVHGAGAVEAAQKLGGPVWAVKAQIRFGGRGKGGGVKVAKSIEDVKARTDILGGMQLVTHQTGGRPEGPPPLHRRRRRHPGRVLPLRR